MVRGRAINRKNKDSSGFYFLLAILALLIISFSFIEYSTNFVGKAYLDYNIKTTNHVRIYDFDESSYSSGVFDAYSESYNGHFSPNPDYRPQLEVQGVDEKAFYFDGNDYFSTNKNENPLLDMNEFTFQAWIKPETYTSGSAAPQPNFIFYRGSLQPFSDSCSYCLFLQNVGGFLKLRGSVLLTSNYAVTATSTGEFELGKWYHVALTYKKDYGAHNLSLYINGELNSSTLLTDDTSTINFGLGENLTLGAKVGSTGNPDKGFTGIIDQFVVRKIAITDFNLDFGARLLFPHPGNDINTTTDFVCDTQNPSRTNLTITVFEKNTPSNNKTGFWDYTENEGTPSFSFTNLKINTEYGVFCNASDSNGKTYQTPVQYHNVTKDIRGLEAYYSFDEGAGNSLKDSSYNSPDGTIQTPVWAPGQSGFALNFSADSPENLAHIPIGATSFNSFLSSPFTTEFSIKPDYRIGPGYALTGKDYCGVLSIGNGLNVFLICDFFISQGRGAMYVYLPTTSGYLIVTSQNLFQEWHPDEWYDVSVTFDGSMLKLFINNNLINSSFMASEKPLPFGDIIIGSDNFHNTNFEGLIDNFKFYNYAKLYSQASEITALFPDNNLETLNPFVNFSCYSNAEQKRSMNFLLADSSSPYTSIMDWHYLDYGFQAPRIGIALPPEKYSWFCEADDWYGNSQGTGINYFTIYSSPEITLDIPIDNYNTTNNNITFQCSMSHTVDFSELHFYSNRTGIWESFHSTNIPQDSVSINIPGFAGDGHYAWNCAYKDAFGSLYWAEENSTLNIYPEISISLISPENSTKLPNNSTLLKCDIENSIESQKDYVEFWTNKSGSWALESSWSYSYGENLNPNVSLSNLAPGNYSWNCFGKTYDGRTAWGKYNSTFEVLPALQISLFSPPNGVTLDTSTATFECDITNIPEENKSYIEFWTYNNSLKTLLCNWTYPPSSPFCNAHNLGEGGHIWNCYGVSKDGRVGWGKPDWSYFVPKIEVSLISPENGNTTTNGEWNLACDITDGIASNNEKEYLYLYTNISGNWELSQTFHYTSEPYSAHTFNLQNVPPGQYAWNCLGKSKDGRVSFAENNYTFTRQHPPVVVYPQSPFSNYQTENQNVVFVCNTTNNSIMETVSLLGTFNGGVWNVHKVFSISENPGILPSFIVSVSPSYNWVQWGCMGKSIWGKDISMGEIRELRVLPQIYSSLNQPEDGYKFTLNNNNISFNCIWGDSSTSPHCTSKMLYTNINGNWENSSGEIGCNEIFEIKNVGSGDYEWNCKIMDDTGREGWAPQNKTFSVRNLSMESAPLIDYLEPLIFNNNQIKLSFRIQGPDTIVNYTIKRKQNLENFEIIYYSVDASKNTPLFFIDTSVSAGSNYIYVLNATNAFNGNSTTKQVSLGYYPSSEILSYNLDDGSGTNIHDSSGKSHHGIWSNPSWSTLVPGLYSAANFSNSPTPIIYYHSDFINDFRTAAFTIEANIKPESKIYGKRLIASKNNDFELFFDDYSGSLVLYGRIKNNLNNWVETTLIDNNWEIEKWHHIAFTFDGSRLRLYKNGILQSSSDFSQERKTTNNSITIGNKTGFEQFSGIVKNIIISSYPKTSFNTEPYSYNPLSLEAEGVPNIVGQPKIHLSWQAPATGDFNYTIGINKDDKTVYPSKIILENIQEADITGYTQTEGLDYNTIYYFTIKYSNSSYESGWSYPNKQAQPINTCGNSKCEPEYGETAATCPADCQSSSSSSSSSSGSPSGSSSGSGGAGGGASHKNLEIEFLDSDIEKIVINYYSARIMRTIDVKQSTVTYPYGINYKSFEITPEFVDGIENTTIYFKASNSWFGQNSIDPERVTMAHLKNNNWNRLKTTLISEGPNARHYKAETAGFSPFAIYGFQKNTPPPDETVDPQEINDTPKNQSKEETPLPQKKPSYILWYLVAGVIALFIGGGAVLFLKRPGQIVEEVKPDKFKQLKEYIDSCRIQGIDDSQITEKLLDAGWDEKTINTLLKTAKKHKEAHTVDEYEKLSPEQLEALRQFIHRSKSQGYTKKQIREMLISAGWGEAVVDEIIK